jgi:uncharacterized protein
VNFEQLFADYGYFTLVLLALTAFSAGFIDAVVGGGGLIQLPFLLITFPHISVPVIFGTNKLAALCGTSVSAIQYSKFIKFDVQLLLVISACCAAASFGGAQVVNLINPAVLKPLILFILIAVALYTFLKKNLGHARTKELAAGRQFIYGSLIGAVVGFYDGFFGPGTGSFFVLGFVLVLGFEFVHASAYAKVVNCVTNIAALAVFVKAGNVIYPLALLLAVFNMTGSYIGSHFALKRGNAFVRNMFLLIVGLLIVKYAYDITLQYIS